MKDDKTPLLAARNSAPSNSEITTSTSTKKRAFIGNEISLLAGVLPVFLFIISLAALGTAFGLHYGSIWSASPTQFLALIGTIFTVSIPPLTALYFHLKKGVLGLKWQATGYWKYPALFLVSAGIVFLLINSYFPIGIIPTYLPILNISTQLFVGVLTAAVFILQLLYTATRKPSLNIKKNYAKLSSLEKIGTLIVIILSLGVLLAANFIPSKGFFAFLNNNAFLSATVTHVFTGVSAIVLGFTIMTHFLRLSEIKDKELTSYDQPPSTPPNSSTITSSASTIEPNSSLADPIVSESEARSVVEKSLLELNDHIVLTQKAYRGLQRAQTSADPTQIQKFMINFEGSLEIFNKFLEDNKDNEVINSHNNGMPWLKYLRRRYEVIKSQLAATTQAPSAAPAAPEPSTNAPPTNPIRGETVRALAASLSAITADPKQLNQLQGQSTHSSTFGR